MESSDAAGAAERLGLLLTGVEARAVSDRLADGETLTNAISAVATERRAELRRLLRTIAGTDHAAAVPVLRAVAAARSMLRTIDPIWTMPGHVAYGGPLTASIVGLVEQARKSVTCSTYNIQRTSGLWTALHDAAQRPGVAVRVYLDTHAADQQKMHGSPRSTDVARHLSPAAVLRTTTYGGARVRNHAKLLAIDHRRLLVTSANISYSAEHANVEFGVLIEDPALTESVENELHRAEDAFYEKVSG